MQNKLKLTLFTISLWSLISCTSVPPDVPVFENLQQHLSTDPVTSHLILKPSPACMSVGILNSDGTVAVKAIGEPECCHLVYIMSGKQLLIGENAGHLLGKKKCSDLKAESVYVPAVESYAPLTKYIINSCAEQNCNDQVDTFKIKLDSLNGINGAIANP